MASMSRARAKHAVHPRDGQVRVFGGGVRHVRHPDTPLGAWVSVTIAPARVPDNGAFDRPKGQR